MRAIVFIFILGCTSDKGISTYNASPTATITSHSDGDSVMTGSEVTFIGSVSDANHTYTELTYTWFAGDELLCAENTPELSGSASCTTTLDTTNGSIRLVVQDTEGAAGTDSITLDILESTPPSITLLSPLNATPYYSEQLISFSALLADAEDPASSLLAAWTSSLDGNLNINATPDSTGKIEGFTPLSLGTHVITLTVTDSTGLFAVVNEIIDVGDPNTDPTCSVLSPTNNDALLSSQIISFAGIVEDAETPLADLLVSWHSNIDGQLGTSTPDTAGEVLYSHPNLSIGAHNLSIRVEDGAGAICTDLITVQVYSAPTVQLTSPSDGSLYQEGESIPFIGLAQDLIDAPESLSIEWSSDLDGVFNTQATDTQGILSFSEAGLSYGIHNIQLSAENSAQVISTATVHITINGIPTTPSITLSPIPATTSDDISASATGSIDPEGASVTYSYEWFKNSLSTGLNTSLLSSSNTQKSEVWTIRVTPSDGMIQGPWAESTITIDNTIPTAPAVTLSPSSPTEGIDDLVCTISIPSTDDDGDALTYTFEWYDPSGNLAYSSGTTTATSDTLSNTSAGVWECVVFANDGQDDGTSGIANVTVQSSFSGCNNGASLVSMAPTGTMALCDISNDSVCEQDFETLCPTGWHLCTHNEFNNRNDGWTHTVNAPARALGVRYCRSSGAGHFTVPDSSSGSTALLGDDEIHNCYFGTSRPECTSGYGCNELEAQAMCCSANPLCGNGVVDSVEENCDDGNSNDGDSCLNVCDNRQPSGSGTNCN